MNHLDFVIWLLGYPLINAACNYLYHLRGGKFSSEELAAVVVCVIYVLVGILLY